MTPPRPFVTLKLATSLDGRIALADGTSRWITGEEARAQVHRLRAVHDAVLVGSETVLADDPELTVRTDPPPDLQPLRIVADGRGRTPPRAHLFATAHRGPVAIATLETTDLEARGWPNLPNLQYWMLPPDPLTGSVHLPDLLATAHEAGVKRLMLEGGGRLAASFLKAGLVDAVEWFRAPIVLGGDARACLGDLELGSLIAAPKFRRTAVREIGADLWESYALADGGN